MVAELDQVRAKLAVAAIALVAACDRPSSDAGGGRSALSDSPRAGVIDSILPPEEALRRFRAGSDRVERFTGATSRDDLVERFIRAVAARNVTALDSLRVTRAEFAWLIYPELAMSQPPYRQPPDIAWLLLEAGSNSGASKMIRNADRFALLGYECPDAAEMEGRVGVTAGCVVRVREGTAEKTLRLFGKVVQLDGRWKFLSLGNSL